MTGLFLKYIFNLIHTIHRFPSIHISSHPLFYYILNSLQISLNLDHNKFLPFKNHLHSHTHFCLSHSMLSYLLILDVSFSSAIILLLNKLHNLISLSILHLSLFIYIIYSFIYFIINIFYYYY
jgi:hypothetical protein